MYIANFWNGVAVSGVDIKLAISFKEMTPKMTQYIEEHYPEYDTITTLKADAMNDSYHKRVEQAVKKIHEKFSQLEMGN